MYSRCNSWCVLPGIVTDGMKRCQLIEYLGVIPVAVDVKDFDWSAEKPAVPPEMTARCLLG